MSVSLVCDTAASECRGTALLFIVSMNTRLS